jgi:alpha-N-acetylglucosaminidase
METKVLFPTGALKNLIGRFLPGMTEQFAFEAMEAVEGKDVWELDSKDGKIVLRGNSAGSMGAAFGYYLKNVLKANIS